MVPWKPAPDGSHGGSVALTLEWRYGFSYIKNIQYVVYCQPTYAFHHSSKQDAALVWVHGSGVCH